jgi:hypothetical protein
VNTTTAETAARTVLVGNIRDLRGATLAEIIRLRRASSTGGAAGEFNSSI